MTISAKNATMSIVACTYLAWVGTFSRETTRGIIKRSFLATKLKHEPRRNELYEPAT